jgi:signal transduction histidine kinase
MSAKQSFTKRRIALIQLERSVELFEAGDFISALTLAGAAEEIFGRMVRRKGKEPRVEYNAEWIGSLYDWAKKPRPSKKQLIVIQNKIRNELKHQDDGRNVRVSANFEIEAEDMILRAMFNYFDAFGCHPASKRLRSWFDHMTL